MAVSRFAAGNNFCSIRCLRAARALGAGALRGILRGPDHGGDNGAVEVGTDLLVDLAGRGRLWLYRPRAGAAQVSKILFFIFLVLFIVILILAISAGQLIF